MSVVKVTVIHMNSETVVKLWCQHDGYHLYRFDRMPAVETKEAIDCALAGHADECAVLG